LFSFSNFVALRRVGGPFSPSFPILFHFALLKLTMHMLEGSVVDGSFCGRQTRGVSLQRSLRHGSALQQRVHFARSGIGELEDDAWGSSIGPPPPLSLALRMTGSQWTRSRQTRRPGTVALAAADGSAAQPDCTADAMHHQ
jgi:hypothetical protein